MNMARRPWPSRLIGLGLVVAMLVATYSALFEPWYRNWGATVEETQWTLPGDEIVEAPGAQTTRAITIAAPITRVWAWLAQVGQDRGGFYSFDLLENLVGAEMPTTDVLRPEWQRWEIDDRLWMYPSGKAGGVGFATLRTLVPGRALAFATFRPGFTAPSRIEGSWAFVLQPIDADHTRLIIRERTTPAKSAGLRGFERVIFSPMHFVMERRMMLGLQALAEGRDRGRLANHARVIAWTLILVSVFVAGVAVLSTRFWRRWLGLLVAAALSFEYLTLRQPMVVVDFACVAALALGFWAIVRTSRQPRLV
jgi:hypothetical protein